MQRPLLLFCCLVLAHISLAQLSGDYTIDPNGSGSTNFTSFNLAVNALSNQGINGPVTFYVDQGTYNEQVSIPSISGTSATNTILFTPDTNNNFSVELEFAVTCPNNYVLSLNGADYIRFNQIIISNIGTSSCGTAVDLRNASRHASFSNCIIEAGNMLDSSAAIYSAGLNDSLSIADCELWNGTSGINCVGTNVSSRFDGLKVLRNQIANHGGRGVLVGLANEVLIEGNQITSDSLGPNSAGVFFDRVDRFDIKGNLIIADSNNGYRDGIRLQNCIGRQAPKSQITNNCVQSGSSSSSIAGNGLYLWGSGIIDISHNSLNNRTSNQSSVCIGIYNGGFIRLVNNIFSTDNGIALQANTGFSVLASDHNVFYTGGQTLINYGSSGGQNFTNIQDFFIATGFDLHSIEQEPNFIDESQCTICDESIDNKGTPETNITTDLFGLARSSSNPDPGCNEFAAPNGAFLGADSSYCASEVELSVSGTNSIIWSVNNTVVSGNILLLQLDTCLSEELNVEATISTEYCGTGNDQVNIILIPGPDLPADSHFCELDSFLLSACGDSNSSFLWSTNQMTSSIVVKQAGEYRIQKISDGCVFNDTINISVSDSPELVDIEDCAENAPITVDGSILNGTTYNWSGGSMDSSAINSFLNSGFYTLTATDDSGCTFVEGITILLFDEPEAVIKTSDAGLNIIFDGSNSIEIGATTQYFWYFSVGATPATSTQLKDTVSYAWSATLIQDWYDDPQYLVVDNGCGVDTTFYYYLVPGIQESNESYAVYPNPAQQSLMIQSLGSLSRKTFSLTSIQGQTIHAGTLDSWNTEIDVSSLPSGIYHLNIGDEGLVKKIVIQH